MSAIEVSALRGRGESARSRPWSRGYKLHQKLGVMVAGGREKALVTGGRLAFSKGYLKRTDFSGSPFAEAVAYSSLRPGISSIIAKFSVMTGRTRNTVIAVRFSDTRLAQPS